MFVDNLGFQIVTLLLAAVMAAYVGVLGFLAMRRNDAAGLKSVFQGAAVPIGGIGVIATSLGLLTENAWPLPGSYNILFTDVYLLFGIVLVVIAFSMAFSLKLQYAGLLGLVAGGVTIAYGWWGLQLGLTKEPFNMFLLYGSFGLAGILSFPAALVADHFLGHPNGTAFAWKASSVRRRLSFQAARRAAQPIAPVGGNGGSTAAGPLPTFRLPIYITVGFLVFVVSMGLAVIAAAFFLNSTIPAHLAKAP